MRVTVTSAAPEKARWTELSVQVTDVGYLLEVAGCSSIEGETARRKTSSCATAEGLLEKLHHQGRGGLSRLALQLVAELSAIDPEMEEACRS